MLRKLVKGRSHANQHLPPQQVTENQVASNITSRLPALLFIFALQFSTVLKEAVLLFCGSVMYCYGHIIDQA